MMKMQCGICLAVLLNGLLTPNASSLPDDSRPDAEALLEKVLSVNRLWLNPSPEHLSYTLRRTCAVKNKLKKSVQRIWLQGKDRARWESRGGRADAKMYGEGPWNHTAVISPERECYLFEYGEKRYERVIPRVDFRYLCMGMTWETAIHAIFEDPEAFDVSIKERKEEDGNEIVIIDTVPKERFPCYVRLSLKLANLWMRFRVYCSLERIRFGILLPDHVPLFEEGLRSNGESYYKIVYGTDYFSYHDQRAPTFIRFHPYRSFQQRHRERIEAKFQIIDGNWLLKEGVFYKNDKSIAKVYLEDVSLEPADPALFNIEDVLPTDYAPPYRLAKLNEGESASIQFTSRGCWHYSRKDLEFRGGEPSTVECFISKNSETKSMGSLEISKEDLAKFDTALDFYRNPYPGVRSSHFYIFNIDWYQEGELIRSEEFSTCAMGSHWEKYAPLSIHTLFDRF